MDRIARLDKEERERLASQYKLYINNLGITEEPKKIHEIIKDFNERGYEITARGWRTLVEDVMYLFIYGEIDFLIVGSKRGYKATSEEADLNAFLKKKHNQFLALASNYHQLKKMCETRKNMKFEF